MQERNKLLFKKKTHIIREITIEEIQNRFIIKLYYKQKTAIYDRENLLLHNRP